ncbi:MAG: tetrahydrodipicolinate N-succinyltransferase N-terminal domain-containing protein [Lentisphaeraceae bacterium]|nr:tetrahydrodipicolinate N-succinyltransferase N-terminal domain-containing protein [Lentisphaeraceae bacterium]
MAITSVDEFKDYVAKIESKDGYQRPVGFAVGVRRSRGDVTLDVTFPIINFEESYGTAAVVTDVLGVESGKNTFKEVSLEDLQTIYNKFLPFHPEIDKHANVGNFKSLLRASENGSWGYATKDIVAYFLYDGGQAVESAEEAYFKLTSLSQRKVQPHGLCLDGAFGKLANVAWTNYGPILPQDLDAERMKHIFSDKSLTVTHVDKFPYLVNYHIPSGTRIASGSQVRLGAYLGEGTTVMPAGYVNFNAGTEGNAMVEGRVSAGVFVKKDSDIGGGASIMGTLSGGNNHVISVGEKCLLGAMAGTGISLGFGCTIAAGAYVTAGSKISLFDAANKPVDIDGNSVAEGENVVKGAELSGKDKMLFIQDSQTGKLICKPNPKTIELNAQLHAND